MYHGMYASVLSFTRDLFRLAIQIVTNYIVTLEDNKHFRVEHQQVSFQLNYRD